MGRRIEIQTGTRTERGTDWPITTTIERDGHGRRPWLVTRGILNGIALSTERFRTRREALATVYPCK
jgi:hypothetical protein